MRLRWMALPLAVLAAAPGTAGAHPLGNFSVNRWVAIEAGADTFRILRVTDAAEIPTLVWSRDVDSDGDGTESPSEIDAFARRRAESSIPSLALTIDGARQPLTLGEARVNFAPGAGGLRTMRIEAVYETPVPADSTSVAFGFDDTEDLERNGWREVIAYGVGDAAVAGADVPASDRSDALRAYPADALTVPPGVARASGRRVLGGEGARAAARTGPGGAAARARTGGFESLIGPADAEFGFGLLLASILGAAFWGAAHALTPGHGKTVVAAYLVGSRGTAAHAFWLGLIVTMTHTIGVFALGGVALLLSEWIVPETLYPWLGLASGLTVMGMGLFLFTRRLARRRAGGHGHTHDHDGNHSHGIPERLRPRELVALGMSGGIVPCPSALVVLLSAIAFHRILFGMTLILAFSFGLASVLAGVGLLMVYARSRFDRLDSKGRLSGTLGLVSAILITVIGAGIAFSAAPPAVVQWLGSLAELPATAPGSVAAATLGLGFLFGLKHATEADHLAAISSVLTEAGGLRRALRVGTLWGAGHTISILIAGGAVLALHLTIPDSVARGLEFAVALMIILLGASALLRALAGRPDTHRHAHEHGGAVHTHLHFHEHEPAHPPDAAAPPHDHAAGSVGARPLLVGMMHGLAGSAALTLLVLTEIPSAALGLTYLLVFGVGSIGGMAIMSVLLSLPFAATAGSPSLNRTLRVAAGGLSLAFGLFYAWEQISGFLAA